MGASLPALRFAPLELFRRIRSVLVYYYAMARGWESKSVEQQIEDARSDPAPSSSMNAVPLDSEVREKREGLLLQRSRVLQEIASARNPRYIELLKGMLRHLETQLSSR